MTFKELFLSMDMFPRRFHLYLPSGKNKYQTCTGLFFSAILVLLLACFIAYSTINVIDYRDKLDALPQNHGSALHSKFSELTEHDYYSHHAVYPIDGSAQKTFDVAWALVRRDSDTTTVNLEKSTATLKAAYK